MKLKFIKPIEGTTISYNVEVQTATVVDVSDWHPSIVGKALRSGDWEEFSEVADATVEAASIPVKLKAKKRK